LSWTVSFLRCQERHNSMSVWLLCFLFSLYRRFCRQSLPVKEKLDSLGIIPMFPHLISQGYPDTTFPWRC
jgi:hypothetical protein